MKKIKVELEFEDDDLYERLQTERISFENNLGNVILYYLRRGVADHDFMSRDF